MLNYKQIWHGIKPTRWLIKFNLTHNRMKYDMGYTIECKKMVKVLPNASCAQERSYVHRILHTYVGWNLCTHELKSKYMRARTSLCTYEFKLRTQEQVCACNPEPAHARRNKECCSSIFSKFSQPKQVSTPPKVSGFHLNPTHSKTKAFTSLKTN